MWPLHWAGPYPVCPKCIPKWEWWLPKHYVLAATPSERLLNLDIAIQTTDTGEVHAVSALLDSGATGLFIDPKFVWWNCLATRSLAQAIPVYNVDRTPNEQGVIHDIVDIVMWFCDHTKQAQSAITGLGKSQMILELSWLWKHNPEINCTTSDVKMSCCPSWCCTCENEVAQEHKVCKASAMRIHTCWAGPLPDPEVDWSNIPDEFPDLPNLCADDDSADDDDSVDISLEDGDCILVASLPPGEEFIHASSTTSQQLAEEFLKNTEPKTFCDSVATHLHDFEDVFAKSSFAHS